MILFEPFMLINFKQHLVKLSNLYDELVCLCLNSANEIWREKHKHKQKIRKYEF